MPLQLMRSISLQGLLIGNYIRGYRARPDTVEWLSQLRLRPWKIKLNPDCSSCNPEHIFLGQFGILFALVVDDILRDVVDAVGAVYLVLVKDLPDGNLFCYIGKGELEIRL